MPVLPAHTITVRFLPQEDCHTQLPAVVQCTQLFAPTPWSGRAPGQERQLCECLCTAEGRAATPLETTFKKQHKPCLSGWGSALASPCPAAGVTKEAALVSPRPSWLRKAFSSLLLAPAHTQLYHGPDEGPPQRSIQRTISKTSIHYLKAGVERRRKMILTRFFSSYVGWMFLFKHSSLQKPPVFHSLTKINMHVVGGKAVDHELPHSQVTKLIFILCLLDHASSLLLLLCAGGSSFISILANSSGDMSSSFCTTTQFLCSHGWPIYFLVLLFPICKGKVSSPQRKDAAPFHFSMVLRGLI